MKKLTLNQMYDLVEFLSDCYEYSEDEYSLSAVNNTLKILGYCNEFHYNYEDDAIICDGGIEQSESK